MTKQGCYTCAGNGMIDDLDLKYSTGGGMVLGPCPECELGRSIKCALCPDCGKQHILAEGCEEPADA